MTLSTKGSYNPLQFRSMSSPTSNPHPYLNAMEVSTDIAIEIDLRNWPPPQEPLQQLQPKLYVWDEENDGRGDEIETDSSDAL